MNPLSGISFYDALSRLSIGLLLSIPFVFTCQDNTNLCCFIPENCNIVDALYILIYYIIGLFFSIGIDKIASWKSKCFIKKYFYKNNLDCIQKIYNQKIGKYALKVLEIDDETYWNIYYCVQKNGLLGNVKALEALSAFLLNLGAVCILYFIWTLEYVGICYCKANPIEWFSSLNSPGWIVTLSVVVFFICKCVRDYIESNIYHNIIMAYKFLLTYK